MHVCVCACACLKWWKEEENDIIFSFSTDGNSRAKMMDVNDSTEKKKIVSCCNHKNEFCACMNLCRKHYMHVDWRRLKQCYNCQSCLQVFADIHLLPEQSNFELGNWCLEAKTVTVTFIRQTWHYFPPRLKVHTQHFFKALLIRLTCPSQTAERLFISEFLELSLGYG